jgi:hypothetical protein
MLLEMRARRPVCRLEPVEQAVFDDARGAVSANPGSPESSVNKSESRSCRCLLRGFTLGALRGLDAVRSGGVRRERTKAGIERKVRTRTKNLSSVHRHRVPPVSGKLSPRLRLKSAGGDEPRTT